jgi:fatty-acyl-CoA synthase
MAVEGVRLAVACNVEGPDGDELAVFVERRGDDDTIGAEVRARIVAELGLDPKVACVSVGGLPRTPSGKLKRSAARALWGAMPR